MKRKKKKNEDDKVNEGFIVDGAGPEGLSCVFEDDGETGYLYVYEEHGKGILKHLQIYSRAENLNVHESDVHVMWSADGTKCGVTLWGGFRGIIDIKNEREVSTRVTHRHSPSITDQQWLNGF
jgi:hypothetical protein